MASILPKSELRHDRYLCLYNGEADMNITAPALRQKDGAQLIALHERLHRLSDGAIGEMRGHYWDNHELIREEMQARGMKHTAQNWLDTPLGITAPRIRPTIVISEYLCATGSLVDPEATHCSDIDIVVRDTEDRGWAQLISEGYRRDAASPPLHFIYNPTGPTSLYVPLADLVLVEEQKSHRLQITTSLQVHSLSIPNVGTIVSGTLYLHESFGEYADALSGQSKRLGVKRIRCVPKADMPYGTPLRLALIPRAALKAINPIKESQIDDTKLPAIQADAAPTPYELKIKILGRRRTDDGRWLYRGSIRLKSGRLQPIETRQQFEGKDELGWEMASDRPQRGYVLGTTRPTDERIAVGAIIRIRPTYLMEWNDKGTHYGWLDACVIGIDTESRQPDSQDVVERIVEATEPLWRGEPIAETLSEDADIEQQLIGEHRCVVYRHIQGVMTSADLVAAKMAIMEATDEDTRAQLWSQVGFEQCKLPFLEIVNQLKAMPSMTARTFINEHLEKRIPRDICWTQVVLRGDTHTALIMDTSAGHVVGWDIETPDIVLQCATNGELYYGLDLLKALGSTDWLAEAAGSVKSIRCMPKEPMPRAWLSIVTESLYRREQAPGSIGATEQAAGIYELVASGRCIYGEQREDYHEYQFKFAPYTALTGRWAATRLADRWLFSRCEESHENNGGKDTK